MEYLRKQFEELLREIKLSISQLGILEAEKERKLLRHEMATSDFWSNNLKAQESSKKEAALTRKIEPWIGLRNGTEGMLKLVDDESLEDDLLVELEKLREQFDGLKKELRFRGPYDDHAVILSIYAGAGGTDAQDWAQMLLRMYVRWAEAHKLKVATVEQSAGEEAGIKSVTMEISGGSYLYGKLSGEQGVHRLVRLSPFNSDNLRQTSFAKVEILPEIEKPNEVEIDENDLKTDVYRAGGHGGQSVNTTDSAVRVTHIPTGITVAIQNERSQLQNKETAMTILRSKLAALQAEQHADNLKDIKGPNQSAEWGNQIRNYVLHPYKQVKDLRNGYESTEPEKVLDGALDPLIDASLEQL
jgi:peptide chain release factor 2